MAERCPRAMPLENYVLKGYKLEFRRVAHIKKTNKPNDKIACGIWKITQSCEKSLDIYEGYPSLYGKTFIKLEDGRKVMTYFMQKGEIAPPTRQYLNTIKEGYKDFDLPLKLLVK